MRRVQLPRPRRPEALARRVLRVPEIEIADLRALGRAQAEDRALGHAPGGAAARGDGEGGEEDAMGGIITRPSDALAEFCR